MRRKFLAATAFLVVFVLGFPAAAQPPAKGAEEGMAVSLRELKAVIDTKDGKDLFGATRLVGFMFAEDARGKDCILILAQSKGQPPLRLDDLVIAHKNSKAGPARPACTIDPRAETLKRLGETSAKISAAREPKEVEKHIAEWRKIAVSPQDVGVFNVPTSSYFAKTMVDADYLLKSICDGTEAVKGVTGFSDRLANQAKDRIAKTGGLDGPLDVMSRFWFNAGKITYRTDDTLFLLTACPVLLLTEQEAVNQEGKRSGAGKENPLAKEFADEFGEKYAAVADAKPIYRQLENLYRAVALVNLMRSEAKARGTLSVIEDTFDAVKPVELKAAETLPGRGSVKKIEGKLSGGSYVLWLPSCGGVSVDIRLEDMKKEPDSDRRLAKLAQAVLAGRPDSRAVSWQVALPAKPNVSGPAK